MVNCLDFCGQHFSNSFHYLQVAEWSFDDVHQNFKRPSAPPTESPSAPETAQASAQTGWLTSLPYDELISKIGLSKSDAQRLLQQAGRNGGGQQALPRFDCDIPEEFLCPITQDVMRYPVLCSDGFIYEKAAIEEWLMSRRKTSPMTNMPMSNVKLEFQSDLSERIQQFYKSNGF